MELNRRNFMKGAAVASAFLPRFNILHADDITIGPKDDTINVAMIGFGAEGKVLAASLVRIPGVYLTSKLFPDTLFPMGLATAAGSLLSVIICVIAFVLFKKHSVKSA